MTGPSLAYDPDALFETLVAAHAGLDEAASRRLDARLILLLAHHIDDLTIIRAAIDEARRTG